MSRLFPVLVSISIIFIFMGGPVSKAARSDSVISSISREGQVAQTEYGITGGAVSRAVFTSGIRNREPVDNIAKVGNRVQRIYYFTELIDMAGQTVIHRWEFAGQTMAEVKFAVGGPRWRVWSSKRLLPQWLGQWRVSVIDATGKVLKEDTFTCIETGQPGEI